MKKYIIYEITNKINGKKYIGCHITEDINDEYMGSGKYLKNAIQKYGIKNFEKIILYFCENEQEMLTKEREIVNEEIVNSDLYYNLSLGGKSWYHINNSETNLNKVIVKDKNGKILKVDREDERYKSGEVISVLKNKMLCRDNSNNFFLIRKNDERYLNGELVPINKGLILVKDITGKISLVSKEDERYKSGELKTFWTGEKHKDETKRKIGEKNSILQKGEKNSQFGTCWVFSEQEKRTLKINKNQLNEYLEKDWKKGRKMNW